MNAELFTALDLLEKENGISKEYMISQIELALANAVTKKISMLPTLIKAYDSAVAAGYGP